MPLLGEDLDCLRSEESSVERSLPRDLRRDPTLHTSDESAASSCSTRSVVNSVLAGYVAGVSGTLVGHPFDSAKVWLQTQNQRQQHQQKPRMTAMTNLPTMSSTPSANTPQQTLRAVHTATPTLRTSPVALFSQIRAFYAGVYGPLLTVGLVQSINFSVYDSMRRFLYYRNELHPQDNTNAYLHQDSLTNVAIASSTAGAVLALFTSPMLITKVQQQTMPGLTFQKALLRTWQTGLFVGFAPHLFSETCGRAAYFCSYEAFKRSLVQYRTTNDNASSQLPLPTLQERVVSAAASGIICWSIIFPLDALRCRLYAQTASTAPRLGTMAMAQHMYQQGWRTFYRGFAVTVVRAGPVAAAVLPMYDGALQFLTQA
jgi:hypothetical protein